MNPKRLLLVFALVLATTLSCWAVKKQKTEPAKPKVELGIWDNCSKTMSDDSISIWIGQLYDAGIRNFYMCGTPEQVSRYIKAAKSYKDAKIHAWMFTMDACRDSAATWSHPEWFEVNRLGFNSLEYNPYVKHYRWLSPAVPEVHAYLKNKVDAYAALEGLASVHLDFIRFNDAILGRGTQRDRFHIDQDTYRAEYDFGYHPLAIEKFKKQFGYSPLELSAPWMSPEWLQFRYNEITELVNELTDEAHSKGVKTSAAVFPFPTRARMMVYQDWPTWKVDILCPMNYQSFYLENIDWIKFSVENGLRETFHHNTYISGIYIHNITAEQIYHAAKISLEAGADGINFFSARSLFADPAKMDVVRRINEEYNK